VVSGTCVDEQANNMALADAKNIFFSIVIFPMNILAIIYDDSE
jgi:hypothetical protein